jgi:hypothetical protein
MTYIYESPDGGKTITRRQFQKLDKEVHVANGIWEDYEQAQARKRKWERIFLISEHDPELKEMLDQVFIFAQLKHPPGRL